MEYESLTRTNDANTLFDNPPLSEKPHLLSVNHTANNMIEVYAQVDQTNPVRCPRLVHTEAT